MPVGKVYQAPTAAMAPATLAPKLMHNPFLEQDAKRLNGAAAPVKRNFVVPPKKVNSENLNGSVQVRSEAHWYYMVKPKVDRH